MRRNEAVLVVDGHPVLRAVAVGLFEELGFKVFDAYNGVDGLRLIAENPDIRLLLADMHLPGMSGIELAESARRLRPGLRTVLASGYVDAAAVPDDMAFVRKPISEYDLRAAGLA